MKTQKAYTILGYILYAFVFSSCHQTSNDTTESKMYSNEKLYIIAKGTTSKSGEIGKSFNQYETDISHIGIGIFKNNQLTIYHVFDSDEKKNALRTESLDEFINLESNKTYSYSIWESNSSISCNIESIINENWKSDIRYDFAFDLSTNNQLYCSEFCAIVLNSCTQFHFEPSSMKLEIPYNHLLSRDTFIYYPADFFVGHEHFSKIYEQHFEL